MFQPFSSQSVSAEVSYHRDQIRADFGHRQRPYRRGGAGGGAVAPTQRPLPPTSRARVRPA
ncbi:hypothetical protein GCM10027446_06790 [Angustibacter peucedani]